MNDDSDVLKCSASGLSFEVTELLGIPYKVHVFCCAHPAATYLLRHVSHFIEPEYKRKSLLVICSKVLVLCIGV